VPAPEPEPRLWLFDQLADEDDVLPLWPAEDAFEERMLPFDVPRRHKKPKKEMKSTFVEVETCAECGLEDCNCSHASIEHGRRANVQRVTYNCYPSPVRAVCPQIRPQYY
jgi:hypothetical protein